MSPSAKKPRSSVQIDGSQSDGGLKNPARGLSLGGSQGAGEQRTEPYENTAKEQSQPATQRPTKSDSSVAGSAGQQAGMAQASGNDSLNDAITYAKRYIEDLLSFFGLNTDVHATSHDDEVIELDIPSTHLNGFLIGAHGDTVRALQFIISSALKSQNFVHARVNVDVAGYKKQRHERLAAQATGWFKQVKDSGEPMHLEPMNPADRRVIHQAATDYGLETASEGEGRDRHVVLRPPGV